VSGNEIPWFLFGGQANLKLPDFIGVSLQFSNKFIVGIPLSVKNCICKRLAKFGKRLADNAMAKKAER
jgi:hypothetical protein